MNIKGIIFDLDGTLTNTLSMCVQGFREAIEPLSGRNFSDAEIIATFGPSEEGTVRALVPERYEEGLAAYLSAYERLLPSCPGLFEGARELLAALRKSGKPVALVTGKGSGSTKLTLAHFKLGPFFSHIATGSPHGSVKALRISEVVEHWGFSPEEVLYVGDAPSDVTAAREAGVQIVAAAWCPEADATTLQSLHPDAVLASIAELKAWLQQDDAGRIMRFAQQVQALAQTGLAFTKDRYDIERYEALREIAAEIMVFPSGINKDELLTAFKHQLGYTTPKVDVRAIVLRDNKVLLVREAEDGLWSLPGGWADVGDRPSEAIAREVYEETGLTVSVERLLGLWDRNLHGHPPYPFHAYKMIFLCSEQDGELRLSSDSLEIDFFDPESLPQLSMTRIVPIEIQRSIEVARNQGSAYFD